MLDIKDHVNIRRRGAIVGIGVASVYALSGFELTFGQHLDRAALFLMQGVPALVAGLAGGWLLAPRAARAIGRREWAAVIVRLGCIAVAIGAIGVGVGLGFESAGRSGANGLQLVLSGIAGGLLLGVAGIVFFGWAMLPVTLLSALVWAIVMRWVAQCAPGRAR